MGEALKPGPEKRPADEIPAPDDPASQIAVRRRITGKQVDDLPPVPDLEDEEDSLLEQDNMVIAEEGAGAQAALGPRTLLKMLVPRANGKETLLSASHIGGRKVWRWQIRAAPAMAGTERAHPADSLQAFLTRHRDSFGAEAQPLIEARVLQLQEHAADAYTPNQQRRIRSDPQRFAVPATPEHSSETASTSQCCHGTH